MEAIFEDVGDIDNRGQKGCDEIEQNFVLSVGYQPRGSRSNRHLQDHSVAAHIAATAALEGDSMDLEDALAHAAALEETLTLFRRYVCNIVHPAMLH